MQANRRALHRNDPVNFIAEKGFYILYFCVFKTFLFLQNIDEQGKVRIGIGETHKLQIVSSTAPSFCDFCTRVVSFFFLENRFIFLCEFVFCLHLLFVELMIQ
jgi:hypothetical protein